LLAFVLYLLWKRSTPSYLLAVCYAVGYAILYGYELVEFFALGNQRAQLPTIATAVSALLILSTIAALVILALDYFDYRNRIPIDH
jgi:hypothetical protein